MCVLKVDNLKEKQTLEKQQSLKNLFKKEPVL